MRKHHDNAKQGQQTRTYENTLHLKRVQDSVEPWIGLLLVDPTNILASKRHHVVIEPVDSRLILTILQLLLYQLF